MMYAYLVCFGAEEQQVEGYGGDDVDEEPALEVVDGNLERVTHHLVVLVHVRRAEVDEDVDKEHDVNDHVYHHQRIDVPAEE